MPPREVTRASYDRRRVQTRVWYSPVRVSTRIVSPGSTKIGTVTTRPVSVVAGLRAPVWVSPAKPGSVSATTRSTVTGSSTPIVSPCYVVRSSIIPSFI